MNKINILFLQLCLMIMMWPVAASSQINTSLAVGTPQGSFAVSSMGGATYAVAVETPKGLPGMQPQIGINYNSQTTNGLCGFGCNLSGFSVITRGPRSIWYDNVASGITNGRNDAFFLDGQRLIEQENVMGCDSSVYCVESNPYTRVVLYGRNASTQAGMWFRVTTADGIINEYGHTSGQQSYTKDNVFKVNAWHITRMENAIGNSMTFLYQTDHGYLYPSSIVYGSNSIEFSFEERPDTIFFSLEGTSGNIGKRNHGDRSLVYYRKKESMTCPHDCFCT